MYIRKASRIYKGKTYFHYLLVESLLTPQGPRQKVICSLGDLSPRPRQDWLALAHKLESALCGQQELITASDNAEVERLVAKVKSSASTPAPLLPTAAAANDELVAVRVDGVCCEESREAGPVHVGCQFWRRLGLDSILEQAGLSEGARRLTLAMTLNRLIHPASELAMPEWIRATALPDILGVDFDELAEDALYRNLDKLHEHRVAIETALTDRERDLFGLDQTIFLYDVTSTYFEGRAMGNGKAKRGYSRDHRGDCKQVLVGLAVNREGFPLAHEVFAGNRHDSTTLEEMLRALDRRVGLRPEQTVVVDRGMAGKQNVEQIRARGLHYLVAEPYAERKDWAAEFQDSGEFAAVEREPSPRNPYQKKSTIQVKMRRVGAETHVLCLSSERKQKDRAIRELHEKRLLADLEKLKKRVAKGKGRGTKPAEVRESIGRLKERYSRVARYYRMEYDDARKTFEYHLEESKRAEAEKLDGSYLLKTDRQDLNADEAWRIYILLTRAEAAFRALKSPLAERPIFHHKECRVEAHIFLCVLAYHLLAAIEKTLLDAGAHTSWATVREQLKTHQVNTIVLPTEGGMELRIRKATTPEPVHQEIYQKLGIAADLMRPHWTLTPAEKFPK
jgi:transposase